MQLSLRLKRISCDYGCHGSFDEVHLDFRRITYIQIVHYKEDSFSFHRDVAEDTDFGTCIMQLNDDFKGGQLNVQGNLIAKNQGNYIS